MRRRSVTQRPIAPDRPPPPRPSALNSLLERVKVKKKHLDYTYAETEDMVTEVNEFFTHEETDSIFRDLVKNSRNFSKKKFKTAAEIPFKNHRYTYTCFWLSVCLGLHDRKTQNVEMLLVQCAVEAFNAGVYRQLISFVVRATITEKNVKIFKIALAIVYIITEAFCRISLDGVTYGKYIREIATFDCKTGRYIPAVTKLLSESLSNPHLPTSKIMLLLWKLIKFHIGSLASASKFRAMRRQHFGLPPDNAERSGLQHVPSKCSLRDVEAYVTRVKNQFLFVRDPSSNKLDYPPSVKEGYEALQKHLHIPLAEVYRREEKSYSAELSRTQVDKIYQNNRHQRVETFFRIFYPIMKDAMKDMLVLLLHCRPAKEDAISDFNFWRADLDHPEEQSGELDIPEMLSLRRTQEITLKAVCATLLLLMKYFKSNHVYQFEAICMHIVDCKGIPVMLRLLNQNVDRYATTVHDVPDLQALQFVWTLTDNNPMRLVKENDYRRRAEAFILDEHFRPKAICDSDDTKPIVPSGDTANERNVFSIISLIRLLQKLVKDKPARCFVLGTEKGSMILKRCLKVEHPMLNLYTLKGKKLPQLLHGGGCIFKKFDEFSLNRVDQTVRQHMLDNWHYANSPMDEGSAPDQASEDVLTEQVQQFLELHYVQSQAPDILEWKPASIPEDIETITVDELLAESVNLDVDYELYRYVLEA
eukprot:gene9709-1917_t